MSNAPQLQPVLDRIDADFDNSLERLFALLRIKSISPIRPLPEIARAAADHLARDIASLGFATEVRRRPVIPPSSPKPMAMGRGAGDHTCCSMGIMTCSRSIRSIFGIVRRSSRPLPTMPTGEKIIVARGAEDDKGQLMTFVRSLPGLEVGHGVAAGRRHHCHRRRGRDRIEEFRSVP